MRSRLLALGVTLAVGVPAAYLTMAPGEPERPAATPAPATAPPALGTTAEVAWRVALPGDVVGLPAVAGDDIVVTTPDSVVSLTPAGDVRWSTPFPRTRIYAPRIDDDLVFVAGYREVVGLRRASGEVVWRYATGETVADRVNRPASMSGVVVITTTGGRVLGLDRSTGELRWATEMATEVGAEVAVLEGVAVVVGRGEWAGFEAANGNRKWSGDLGLIGTSSPVAVSSEAGSLAIVASDEKLIAVSLFTGEPRWHGPADQSELAQVPLVAGDEIFVPDHWGRVTVYALADGTRRWKATGADGVAQFGQPVVLGRRLVAMSLDEGGPRLASDSASSALRPPAPGFGVAGAGQNRLLVSTWGDAQNYLLAYDLDMGDTPPSR